MSNKEKVQRKRRSEESHAAHEIKLGVIFLRRKRPGFDPAWGKEMEAAARNALEKMDYDVFISDEQIVDGASLRRALAQCRRAESDVLLALQPTMSDGKMAPILGQMWDAPVVLWATPERQEGSLVSACSLVGAHMFASILRQLNRPFEIAYGSPGTEETQQQLSTAIRIGYTVSRLQKGTVGLVGYHAPGYTAMHADPFRMSRQLGLQLHHYSLQEFTDRMNQFSHDEVDDDVGRVINMGLPLEDVSVEELKASSRYYLAMDHIIHSEQLRALAVRDWPEMSDGIGQWPYLAMARLSTEGFALSCEGDLDGAISCLIGNALGLGTGYLSDWLEHDHNTITLWHTGSAPLQLLDPPGSAYGPRIGRHFNNQKPAVINANLRVGIPITVFRIWCCDNAYRMMAFEAETITPRRELKGTNGLARVTDRNVYEWFNDLCQAGMPHHVVVVCGHHSKTLHRLSKHMKMDWIG